MPLNISPFTSSATLLKASTHSLAVKLSSSIPEQARYLKAVATLFTVCMNAKFTFFFSISIDDTISALGSLSCFASSANIEDIK